MVNCEVSKSGINILMHEAYAKKEIFMVPTSSSGA